MAVLAAVPISRSGLTGISALAKKRCYEIEEKKELGKLIRERAGADGTGSEYNLEEGKKNFKKKSFR